MKDFLRKKRAGGKLTAHFKGPYEIKNKVSRGIYSVCSLSDPKNVIKKVSGAHMKPYIDPCNNDSSSESNDSSGDESDGQRYEQHSCRQFEDMNDDSSNSEVFTPSKRRRCHDSFLSDSSSMAERSPVGTVNDSINTVDRLSLTGKR